MKQIILLASLCFCSFISFSQTQSEINNDAMRSYLKADSQLNRTYQKILTEYKTDTLFIRNFKVAQRLWLQLRDAEMKAKFPEREDGYYGSVLPMCWYMHIKNLTIERTNQIKVWLDGIEEGDVCSGSVKVKSEK